MKENVSIIQDERKNTFKGLLNDFNDEANQIAS